MFEKVGTGIGVVILLMVILIIILAVITISMSMRLSRLTRRYRLFMKGKDGITIEEAFEEKFKALDKLEEQCGKNSADLKVIKASLGKTLTHYGVVKYDAFDDVGGKMSFVLAMLDSDNSGFILDTIHSRDNCFVYIKEFVKGESYIMLSKEEIEALKQASNAMEEEDLEIKAQQEPIM